MPDHMRWRYGDTTPVVAEVDADVEIEIGDLVFQDIDDAKPANLTERDSVDRFTRHFLGVAMQRSRFGDTTPIRVATTGVFEFVCPSGTFELGELMGVDRTEIPDRDGNPHKSVLANQRVAKTSEPELAIARVAKRVLVARNSVFIDIRSTVMTGGVAGTTAK